MSGIVLDPQLMSVREEVNTASRARTLCIKTLFTWHQQNLQSFCQWAPSRQTSLALSFLDPNADWANLIKCLQTSSTDSLEQSTSPTLPATAETQNNFTAAQASNQNDVVHSSGDSSTTRCQRTLMVVLPASFIAVGFYTRAKVCSSNQGSKGSVPN